MSAWDPEQIACQSWERARREARHLQPTLITTKELA